MKQGQSKKRKAGPGARPLSRFNEWATWCLGLHWARACMCFVLQPARNTLALSAPEYTPSPIRIWRSRVLGAAITSVDVLYSMQSAMQALFSLQSLLLAVTASITYSTYLGNYPVVDQAAYYIGILAVVLAEFCNALQTICSICFWLTSNCNADPSSS